MLGELGLGMLGLGMLGELGGGGELLFDEQPDIVKAIAAASIPRLKRMALLIMSIPPSTVDTAAQGRC